MAIYTKGGDKGKTSLYSESTTNVSDKISAQKKRVSKDSLEVRALGVIDELNSFLGVTMTISENQKVTAVLKEIQKDLFTIGSILAGSDLRFFKNKTKHLEKAIDKLEGRLPVLQNFILPNGSKLSSHLQYARALSRRVEREVVTLARISPVKPQILTYLNRLSDYLFMLARDANYKLGVKEEAWIGKRK